MIFLAGETGKRKKRPARLSIDRIFGFVVLNVWEGNEITHSFNATPDFLRAMQTESALDIRMLEEQSKIARAKLFAEKATAPAS